MYRICWVISLLLLCVPWVALSEEIPEEVLRTEIYTGAYSPRDGKYLTAQEYALLQEEVAQDFDNEAALSPQLKDLIQLLRIRKLLRQIYPF